jgi:hypothetical protein
MPIPPFLNGERFDLEGERVIRLAFEMVCVALRTGNCDDGAKQAIATKLITLTKADESPFAPMGRIINEGSRGFAHAAILPSVIGFFLGPPRRAEAFSVGTPLARASRRQTAIPGLLYSSHRAAGSGGRSSEGH